jgi:hypothetical protein
MNQHDQAQTATAREIRESRLQLSAFWYNMKRSQPLSFRAAAVPGMPEHFFGICSKLARI